jgi:selenide,water dikinase
MQNLALPIVHDIVLVGGGHTHALVLQMWAMASLPGVRLTLVTPSPSAPYTGMLPGFVAGHYAIDDLMIDLVILARRAGARLILDHVTGIDRAAKKLLLGARAPLPYDLASIDIGITSDLPDLPGFAEHGLAAKPLGPFAARWQAFADAPRSSPGRVTLIGGGVGGVELALAAHHRLSREGAVPQVSVVERGLGLAPLLRPQARAHLLAAVHAAGIEVLTGTLPTSVSAAGVQLENGQFLAADLVLAVAGARPQGWLATTGLSLARGFVEVDRHLQTSDPAIFATGDCAHLTASPRPKAGVFAVRAEPFLLHNLKAALTGASPRAFDPQGDYLKLITLGPKRAVAEKWGLTLQGAALWRWKDRIDAKFMAKFAPLPMQAPALPKGAALVTGLREAMGDKPLCGGCGAKLGADALADALQSLPPIRRADVLQGAGDDAAVLSYGDGVQVITTDHLRGFTADAGLMARLAAIHALGDIWAMGAAPQAALSQIILPPLSPTKAALMLAEITAAAAEIFGAEGAEIVGGHSSFGAELTIGFTVTGLAPRAIAKTGPRSGDALILTKPIGTGTILAAEMSGQSAPGLILGEAVAAAHKVMSCPMGEAARILTQHAHAMTDVTGFGLAGHILEMLRPRATSEPTLGATLEACAIPVLPGARALAAAGVRSSLAFANEAALQGRLQLADGPLRALMVDPQTCGGLLAALPEAITDKVLAELHAAGLAAVKIGVVTAGPTGIYVTGQA